MCCEIMALECMMHSDIFFFVILQNITPLYFIIYRLFIAYSVKNAWYWETWISCSLSSSVAPMCSMGWMFCYTKCNSSVYGNINVKQHVLYYIFYITVYIVHWSSVLYIYIYNHTYCTFNKLFKCTFNSSNFLIFVSNFWWL